MKLKIYQAGEPILRQKAKILTDEEIKSDFTKQLIELMRDTMHDFPGIGLAAPQVGVSLQLFVIEDLIAVPMPEEILEERQRMPIPFHVVINPIITFRSSEMITLLEGCMSVREYRALIPRHQSIKVDCLNELGEKKTIEAEGWYARILQHEIDHLEGSLYVDKMYSKSFISHDLSVRQKLDFKPISELQELLLGKG